MALRFAAVGHLLLQIAPDAQIVFSGGALDKLPLWQPIVCDAIGSPLLQSCEAEASARGASRRTCFDFTPSTLSKESAALIRS